MDKVPAEVLSQILTGASSGQQSFSSSHDTQMVQSLRLVSRRFSAMASCLLIESSKVYLTSKSLSRFETLCRHPVFSRSIKHVTINASYYDPELAKDLAYFTQERASNFYQTFEILERALFMGREEGKARSKLSELYNVPDEVEKVGKPGFVESTATPYQRMVIDYHKKYQERAADQEALRKDNKHLQRLCSAISNLPALERLSLEDHARGDHSTWRAVQDDKIGADDPRILGSALETSTWKGTFYSAFRTQQPLEMVGELLSRLGRSGVRPREFGFDFRLPTDLKRLEVSEDQSLGIRDLLSQAKDVNVRISGWARKGSLAENNDRSVEEMCALGSLTKALTHSPTLEHIVLEFTEYPVFYQFPTVSIDTFLPLGTATTTSSSSSSSPIWPNLQHLRLSHVPMDINHLEALINPHRDVITSLEMAGPFLRTGDWDRALDIIRGLNKLKHAKILYPRGGAYGDRYSPAHRFPDDEAAQYVLRNTSRNPISNRAEL